MDKWTVINIKPLSVNEAFQGRRFKTNKYTSYDLELTLKLPKMDIPDGDLIVQYEFGFSSKLSDIDNPVKATTDIICKKYGFDDRQIQELHLKKRIVKKGQEYIKFKIDAL